MSDIKFEELKKGDIVYWARVLKNNDSFKIHKMKLRTIEPDYVVGSDSVSKFAKDFTKSYAEQVLFKDIKLAQDYLKEQKKLLKEERKNNNGKN